MTRLPAECDPPCHKSALTGRLETVCVPPLRSYHVFQECAQLQAKLSEAIAKLEHAPADLSGTAHRTLHRVDHDSPNNVGLSTHIGGCSPPVAPPNTPTGLYAHLRKSGEDIARRIESTSTLGSNEEVFVSMPPYLVRSPDRAAPRRDGARCPSLDIT